MKHPVLALLLLGAATVAARAQEARAQDAVPDLRGTWTGKGKAVLFGANAYHPGTQTHADPPRVHEIEATHVVEGQDGPVAWGHSSSTVADTKEPFTWAISADNKTIVGANEDGYFLITLISPDRMQKCYTQNGVGPTHAIVSACYMMDRKR